MASNISWLYNLARRPVVKKHPTIEASFFGDTSQIFVQKLEGAREYVDVKVVLAREFGELKYEQLCQYIDEIDFESLREDMKKSVVDFHVSALGKARNTRDFLASLDPKDIPEDMIIPLALAVLATIVLMMLLYRKRQQRIQHKQRYGENVFPPYAPCNSWETASALSGKEQPWFFKQCAEMVGPIFQLRLPFARGQMFVAIGDVETAKEILQDPETTKPANMYRSITSIAGGPNIVTSDGLHWKLSRKCLSPAFMKTHLDRMHRVCKDQTEEWIENRLERAIQSGKSFDIGEECMHLTISIICRAAFEYKITDSEAKALMKDLEKVSGDYSIDGIQSPFRNFFGRSQHTSADAQERIRSFGKKILSSYRKGNNRRRKSVAPVKESIISLINKSTNYDDDAHRIADIVMLIISGHDTTAYTLAWTLLELARNPSELMELRNALSGNDDDLAQQMLKDILREGMRLRPVSPGIGVRMIGKDFYLKDKAVVIPKGSHIVFPSMILTRNQVENAEAFIPTRWAQHPHKTFLPFSTGKRNCIGQALALAEVTWVLSRLCAKYDFEVEDEGKAEFSATLKCVGARLRATHYR